MAIQRVSRIIRVADLSQQIFSSVSVVAAIVIAALAVSQMLGTFHRVKANGDLIHVADMRSFE